ncbi:MAG: energy transducer TonB [Alphaproteobacteria bacterium]|nr:MAG: energy transducer TonB [Alphaproteobacteria bacterium]
MTQARIFPITGGAAVATFGLFYLMQGLVAMKDIDLPAEPDWPSFEGYIDDAKPEPVRKIDRVVRPPEPLPVPPQPKPGPTPDIGDPVIHIGPPPVAPTAGPGFGRETFGMVDGGMIPIVRVQPNYPSRAASEGIEGWVVVEFTVSAQGDVVDPVIIDAEPRRIFDRSTLQAVAKFKYKPTVVDGRAVPTKGVRFRMVYTLQE